MSNSPPLKIGYIGLGNAGYPLASNIAKAGYQLLVHDSNPDRTSQFISEHPNARIAPSRPEAFKDVDILVTMLPNGTIVQDILLNTDHGIAKHLKNGAVIVDTSSSSPFQTRQTASLLHQLNPSLTLIDSPITQPYTFALAKGDATLMIGCSSPPALQRALPVLKSMGRNVFVMGKLGAGHAMKTLNNYVSMASILGLCDALMVGEKFGLEGGKMVEVMNAGTGGNFSTRGSFREDGLTRRFKSGYQLALLLKDMRIAKEVIEEMGVAFKLPDLMIEALEGALKVAGPEADHTEVIKFWEERAGFQLRQSKL